MVVAITNNGRTCLMQIADHLRKGTSESSRDSMGLADNETASTQSSEISDRDARNFSSQASSLVGSGLQQQAARILLGFLGAVQGSRYSVNAFLEELLSAYL